MLLLPAELCELDRAVGLVVPGLEEKLNIMLECCLQCGEVNYWFGWELVPLENDHYLVGLKISQGSLNFWIGLPGEWWDVFYSIREKEDLLLLVEVPEQTEELVVELPYGLIIRSAIRGLDGLLCQVTEQLMAHPAHEELARLQEILTNCWKPQLVH